MIKNIFIFTLLLIAFSLSIFLSKIVIIGENIFLLKFILVKNVYLIFLAFFIIVYGKKIIDEFLKNN